MEITYWINISFKVEVRTAISQQSKAKKKEKREDGRDKYNIKFVNVNIIEVYVKIYVYYDT